MGWPVRHSRSPRLHGYWLAHYGIDGVYLPFPVQPEHLRDALRALPMLGIMGVNLTIPHKEAALAIMDEIHPEARLVGAVNTVVVGRDGRLFGSNTDIEGFRSSLLVSGAPLTPAGSAVVIGAGGAARGVIAALGKLGFRRIRLVNRTPARSEGLIRDLAPLDLDITPVDWDARDIALEGAGLLVNTTSLGMAGEPELDLDLGSLPADAVVTDIVYAPLETPLLAAARARGLFAVDGLGMLLHQARPGFHAWFGRDPEVTPALRAHVLG